MSKLDDLQVYERGDLSGMARIVFGFPQQFHQALTMWPESPFTLASPERPEQVVIAGMGGSAIGGDLLAALCADELALPMETWRNYSLPAYCGPRTLLFL